MPDTPTGFAAIAERARAGGPVAVPGSWRQGRTAYGGLTAALCVEAARAAVPDLPPLRSLHVNFTGPVLGDPAFAARLLRRGRNVVSVGVDGTAPDKAGEMGTVAGAQAVFGADRDSILDVDLSAPDVPAPDDAEPFFPEAAQAFAPAFFSNFEVRMVGGHRPASGAPEGHVLTWARHRDPASRVGESAFVCLGDVLPPAAFPMMRELAPISSVNWALNLLRAPDTDDGWYLVESRQTAARAGYSSQVMRYWNTDGQLVGEAMQAVAVFA